MKTRKIWVVHHWHGCETGCCGHRVETDIGTLGGRPFKFEHPYDVPKEEWEAWARLLASEYEGEFDWSRCEIRGDLGHD
jgi:hypothetical protein